MRALRAAGMIIRKRSRAVVAFGGFASGPAAWPRACMACR
jgi:hypothetical protein